MVIEEVRRKVLNFWNNTKCCWHSWSLDASGAPVRDSGECPQHTPASFLSAVEKKLAEAQAAEVFFADHVCRLGDITPALTARQAGKKLRKVG
jgi:hypothetical protein